MLLTRRDLLAAAGAAAAVNAAPAFAAQPRGNAASEAKRRLDRTAEALLAEFPENATALGLDKGARAGLKRRLTDRTAAGHARRGATAAARLARLRALDRNRLDAATRADLDVVIAAHELAVEGHRFGFGDVVTLTQQYSYRNSPYAVAQNTGAFVEVPDFLDSNHLVETRADAEAYLARLSEFGRMLDGETERLRADAAKGVIAPDFIIDKTVAQMRTARAIPAAQSGLATSLARRAAKLGPDYGSRATRIVERQVYPALDRQMAELTRLRARATAAAGVWHVPRGDEYYAWALRAATTTTLSPDEVHRQGREQLAALQGQMDALLKAQGLSAGSVGERMTALGKQARHLYPNTDAGRAQLLDYINGKVADVRTRLPRAFATLVPGRLVVKRVPPAIEAGAPRGYAAAGTIDGSVPGQYYINLADTATWPRYTLPTLTYHEGIPGHIWQGEYTYKLPLIRSLLAFNAYSEGWALYAEQLGDELGVYADDPLGRLGYLQSIAFRAARMVVDTGLHAKRWDREQAVRYFVESTGTGEASARSEVDRYCVWPGQATGYKVGHNEINRLRDRARTQLGARYDFKLFNDAVVKAGGVPLTVLERQIDAHIGARRRA